jgi:hypothetical protein
VAIETPPEQLPQEPHQDYREAKAKAKAAKAYAKARRPWYRKKRIIALMAIGGIFLIAIISAASGGTNSATTPTPAPTSAAPTASTPAPAETSTPEPTPDPEVSVNYTGPFNVHSDNVVLKGTVDPANAHVRVKGQFVKVRHGHWTLPVTLTKHGDNTFRVVATRKGYVKSSTTTTIVRELSAAERAVIRREKAARRANRRALQSAESYLAMSGFSKQGLYEQLSSAAGEGFTQAEAQYAVDHVGADWNKEAVESARSYLDMSPMSRNELIEQLSSSAGEGFTYEQAVYAVNKAY